MRAIEAFGEIDKDGRIKLEKPIDHEGKRVKVIILFSEEIEISSNDQDITFLTSDSASADNSSLEKCLKIQNLAITVVTDAESASHPSVLM